MYTLQREMYADFLKSGGEKESYDTIIIGSGMSALTTAVALARSKKRVLILESHHTPGGFTHTFTRKNFEWDVGVHYIGETNNPKTLTSRLFESISEGRLKWADMGEVYDRAYFNRPGKEPLVFGFVKGLDNLKAALTKQFPNEEQAIDAYWELVQRVNKKAMPYFTDKALPPTLSKLIGPFMRAPFFKLADQTTWEVLSQLTKNEELIAVLCTQWGDAGLPPKRSSFAIHAMIANHYVDGAAYPIGGSSRIAESIVPSILSNQGRVVVRAKVHALTYKDGVVDGVMMDDGVQIRAKTVVSSVGIRNSAKLAPEIEMPAPQSIRASVGHLCLYVGLDKTAAELNLPKENHWKFPSIDHDANFARFLRDPSLDFPVLYFSYPSAKDPEWQKNHPGTAAIDLVTVGNYSWFRQWAGTRAKARGDDYTNYKAIFQKRLEEEMVRHLPQIKGHIVHSELSTPLTTQHYCQYEEGEIYGLNHEPARFRTGSLRPHTNIKGFYLTGQDIVSCGVAGALSAGVITASAILKRDCMKMLTR